jgi:hypothetical protein
MAIIPAVHIEQVDDDTIILTENVKSDPIVMTEEEKEAAFKANFPISVKRSETWVPEPIKPREYKSDNNDLGPNVISINSSVPNDGRSYYAMIIFNGHSEETLAYKIRNRQIVEVEGASYTATSKVIPPESFIFVRCCEAKDFK